MFQLLEIVGVSKESYSQAIKKAIKQLQDAGESVFWFEVMEERGGVRGDSVEFQVKIKVAVKVESEEEKGIYLCPSCGRASDKPENLCNPKKV
jgi:flavin-binding protein dodecin